MKGLVPAMMNFQPRTRNNRAIKRIKRLLNCLYRRKKNENLSFKGASPQLNTTETKVVQAELPQDVPTAVPELILKKNPPPFHLTLLGLPRELRDMIFHHVFDQNGQSYVHQQLLGFPKKDHSTYSGLFRVLLTCRQIYAEAYSYAYRLSCFYWFRSYSTATLDRLWQRLSERQAENVRHIAFWSNPYLDEDFLDDIPDTLRLTRVTVCSNYMSGPVPPTTIHGRMLWLLKHIKTLRTLTSFYFLTGCGISPMSRRPNDCDFAMHLRRAFDAKEYWGKERQGLEVGRFDPETLTTQIVVLPDGEIEGGKNRLVELKIASIYEQGFGSG